MTIIFNNNSFKYETEATVKLFIPAEKFNFLYDAEDAEGDVVITRIRRGKKKIYLYAYVRMGERKARKCKILSADIQNTNNACEYGLCRLVYICLQRLTGINHQWGLLTGIRPVKKFNAMIKDGKNYQQISEYFKDRYLVSESRCKIAYKTAMTQLPLLENLNRNAVSIYISIPFCPTRCSYCSFVSHSMQTAQKLIPQYIRRLCDELEIIAGIINEYALEVDTIYFGGGTPTSLSALQLEIIMKKLSECIDIGGIREYSVEAGRPDTITADKLDVIKRYGADRISINPQTLNDNVLSAIGRKHTAQQTIEAFNLARKKNFDNINMDLIAGLPEDTTESFRSTVDRIKILDPDSITVHTLTIKRSAGLYETGSEYIGSPVLEMTNYAEKVLTENGYMMPYYLYRQKNTAGNLENIGYAKKGKESLYNIFIMDEIQTILGAGCGASTKLVGSDGKITRVHNYKFPYEYINRFSELMEKKQAVTAFLKENM